MNHISMIPAVRVSDQVRPELRVWSDQADQLELRILQMGHVLKRQQFCLQEGSLHSFWGEFGMIAGDVILEFVFLRDQEAVEIRQIPYQIICTGRPGTGLLDGCWISLYHWSEEEGRLFNPDLKKLTDGDFAQQVRDMNDIGIRGIVIQNLFVSDAYVGRHTMTCESYSGQAFYPSEIYSGRVHITAKDPVEAVLQTADECGMHVLMGVGLFAWFDFSAESLRWHKIIAEEIFDRYGHHPSFYGWYVSEEIMGDLYFSYMPENCERWKELPMFFREFREFIRQLTPTKPVAFAPNNVQFEKYEQYWRKILPYIDILIPFAFARDPEHWNIDAMKQICDSCRTHMWVDMEIFDMPFENGLFPKNIKSLKQEIESYHNLEQCYGYQYTGLLNHPQSHYNLGGENAKTLYRDYRKFYQEMRNAQQTE